MAVVINTVLPLPFLKVVDRCLRVRPDARVRVQQYLLETPANAHAFVLCQVLEESGGPLFQS